MFLNIRFRSNIREVKITKVNKVENPNYLFVDLTIDSKSAKAGKFTIDMLQNGKTEGTYTYELKKNRKPGSAIRQGFSPADVVYLLMPDRFANGDPSNDNMSTHNRKRQTEPSIMDGMEAILKASAITSITLSSSELQLFGVLHSWKTISINTPTTDMPSAIFIKSTHAMAATTIMPDW